MNRRSIEAGKAVIVIDILDKATSRFNKLTAKLTNSARAFNDIGRQSAGAGLLTGLASRSVIKNFTDFEDKILNLSAKLGYFGIVTKKQDMELKSLTKTIIDLGRVTSYTSAEVADAAISLAQAGFSVTEIKSSLQSVLDLARGTNYALGESADLLANTIRTFNMFKPGDSAEVLAENMQTINHVSSMMVKATRLGTIEIEDLRQSMKYAAGTATNLGASLPVVLGLLVQMSESGLKASLAGTSMNTAFLNLIGNMDKLQQKLPNFKVFADSAGNIDFSQTLGSLMEVTSSMNKIDKTKIFQEVFNIRGARMISSIQEMERVQYFIKEIALAGEEARLSAAKMESGLGGAVRRLTSGLEALNIAMGYTFKDGATAMANLATVGVAALEKLTAKYKLLVGALVFSPVIFAAVAAGAFTMSIVLARLRSVVGGLVVAFKGLKSVGGIMASSAMSAASGVGGLITRPGMRAAAMAAQAKKVAKLQARIDKATLKANARKTPAGQQAALAKINTSKTMQALKAAQAKMAAFQKKNPLNGIGSFFSGVGKKVSALNETRKQRAEIKAQSRLEQTLQKKMIGDAVKNKRAIYTQAKDTTNISNRIQKITKLDARRARINTFIKKQMNEQAFYMKELNKVSANENAVEKAYDRLYKIRKQLESTPTVIKGKGGQATPNRAFYVLKEREKKLANFINTNQKQNAFKRIELEKRIARSADAVARRSGTAGSLGRRIQVQKSQISASKKIAINGARAQQRGIAKVLADGLRASNARIAAGQRAMRGASYMKTLFSGAKIGNLFVTLGRGITTVASLAKSFSLLTFRLTRFVFSWNFVGLALNALLLFGDKIAFIRKAFDDLGKGFGAAFAEIGKIATYAAPAIELFGLAFKAFVSGETGIGVQALSAAFTGLVSIIGNQLTAAWAMFQAKVADLWVSLKQIGTAIGAIVGSLIQGIVAIGGVALKPILDSIKGISVGEGSFVNTLYSITISLDNFITDFNLAILTLVDWGNALPSFWAKQLGLKDPNGIKNAIKLTGPLGNIIGNLLPGLDEESQAEVAKRRNTLTDSRDKRQKDLFAVFQKLGSEITKSQEKIAEIANSKSFNMQGELQGILSQLTNQFDLAKYLKELDTQRLADLQSRPQANFNAQERAVQEMKQFVAKLKFITGSISQVMGNRVLKETPEELQRETNDLLREINRTIVTQGGM